MITVSDNNSKVEKYGATTLGLSNLKKYKTVNFTFTPRTDITSIVFTPIIDTRQDGAKLECKIERVGIKGLLKELSTQDRTYYIRPTFTLIPKGGDAKNAIIKNPKLAITIPKGTASGSLTYSLAIVDTTASSVISLLT
jgi:hypothetical protein